MKPLLLLFYHHQRFFVESKLRGRSTSVIHQSLNFYSPLTFFLYCSGERYNFLMTLGSRYVCRIKLWELCLGSIDADRNDRWHIFSKTLLALHLLTRALHRSKLKMLHSFVILLLLFPFSFVFFCLRSYSQGFDISRQFLFLSSSLMKWSQVHVIPWTTPDSTGISCILYDKIIYIFWHLPGLVCKPSVGSDRAV